MNSQRLPSLRQFFGGYFHQDWETEYEGEDKSVDAFIHESSFAERREVLNDLDVLIVDIAASDEPDKLLSSAGCDYRPAGDGYSVMEWLLMLRLRIATQLTAEG